MKRETWFMLGYFLLLALCLVWIVPPWEPPDEPSHMLYVNYVAQNCALPNQNVPAQSVVGEGHQPPLYYLLGALLNRAFQPGRAASLCARENLCGVITSAQTRRSPTLSRTQFTIEITPVRNPKHIWNKGPSWEVPVYKHLSKSIFRSDRDRYNFYALRLLSVLLATLNVALMFKVFRLFLPEGGWALAAGLFVVTLPQFLFMSAAIDNDNLANLLCTASLYLALRIFDSPVQRRNYLALGIVLGLGLLTKKTLLFTVPVIVLILAYVAWRHRPQRQTVLRYGALLLVIALLLGGLFFLRNYRLYGEWLGTQMEKRTLIDLVQEKSLLSPYFLRTFPLNLFLSYVGKFGYMNASLPKWAYLGYALIIAVGVVGLALYLHERRFRDARVGFAVLFILSCLAGIVVYNLTYSMPQGRFLFPVISLLAALLTLGWKAILERVHLPWARRATAAAVVLCLLALDVTSLIVIYQFYHAASQYW